MTLKTLSGVPQGADAFAIQRLIQNVGLQPGQRWLHVCDVKTDMEALAAEVSFCLPEANIFVWPGWGRAGRPFSLQESACARQVEVAGLLGAKNADAPFIVLTDPEGFAQKVPSSIVNQRSLVLKEGGVIERDTLLEQLQKLGMQRADQVDYPGRFAVRGSLVDLWPFGATFPLRMDFFDDTLEAIRTFDPLSQRSQETLKQCALGALHAFGDVSRFYDTAAGPANPSAALPGQQLPFWLPFVHGQKEPLKPFWTLFPPKGFSINAGAMETLESLDKAMCNVVQGFAQDAAFQAACSDCVGKSPETLAGHAWAFQEAREGLFSETPGTMLQRFGGDAAFKVLGPQGFRTHAKTSDVAADLAKFSEAGRVLLTAANETQKNAFQTFLKDARLPFQSVKDLAALFKLKKGVLGLSSTPQEDAFQVMDVPQQPPLTVIPFAAFFRDNASQVRPPKRQKDAVISDALSLGVGDLITHVQHGIGRYQGLQTLTIDDAAHDCLVLSYADDNKLYVPAENMDQVLRYGPPDAGFPLDRLGSSAWQTRKKRVQKKIEDMSHALLDMAAKRALENVSAAHRPDSAAEERFLKGFGYAETEDQESAIQDVLEDLQDTRPMDRLICGDVGFGKTEVALRAAFYMASSGMQVAVVVPTTLLARQHARLFQERFQGTGLGVVQLSRFVGTKAAAAAKEDLKSGKASVVIGTHALLARDVGFKNLGLLIIDEEQRFGVKHKEQLKNLKSGLHVLTLTATPIPRTLHMALSDLKSLSLITTPPPGRKAIETQVLAYQKSILKKVLSDEKVRGGQSFCVAPRIQHLVQLEKDLASVVPDLKVGVAHGQMPTKQLSDVMSQFEDGALDVLLATPIIEAGIDVHQANTLVVYRADLFGLADLYQLRGRVGRGGLQGYAYLTVPSTTALEAKTASAAAKRLSVMQSLDYLGAGFSVATHDMDIRGAGNLIGAEQSGQMREVGVAYYQKLLTEAVQALRAQKEGRHPDALFTPTINTHRPALFPEDYVPSLEARLGLYRRLSSAEDAAVLDDFADELKDRFGALPEEVSHLLEIARLKLQAKAAFVVRIDMGPKGSVLRFFEDRFPQPEKLLQLVSGGQFLCRFRPDSGLFLGSMKSDWPARLRGLQEFLTVLAGLCA